MEKIRRCLKNEKGFTLIEMAIVLIIIGIILGATVKGKDIMRSAQIKKVYTAYFNAWNLANMTNYDRTGSSLPTDASTGSVSDALQKAGITSPGATYDYQDSAGTNQTMTVTFENEGTEYNYMKIDGIPSELGVAIDKIVDGVESGTTGDFLAYEETDTTNSAWSDTGTDIMDARWKMQF